MWFVLLFKISKHARRLLTQYIYKQMPCHWDVVDNESMQLRDRSRIRFSLYCEVKFRNLNNNEKAFFVSSVIQHHTKALTANGNARTVYFYRENGQIKPAYFQVTNSITPCTA